MRRSGQLALTVCLVLAWGVSVAAFKDDYVQALEEIDRGNFDRAVALLQAAINEEPDSQARIRLYGMRYSPYVPHYHLGVAQYNLGDCASAQRSFATATQNGIVTGLSENASLKQYDADCAEQMFASSGQRQQQVDALQAELRTIGDNLGQTRNLSNDAMWGNQWQADGNLRQQADALAGELTQLQSNLTSAQNDAELASIDSAAEALASRANQFASQVSAELRALQLADQERRAAERRSVAERTAQQREAQRVAQAEKDELNRSISQTVEQAGELVNSWPEPIAQDSQRSTLAQLVRRVYGAGDASVSQLRALDRDLKTAITAGQQRISQWQGEQATRPPDELVAAVNQYFQGNFADTIALLATAEFDSQRARFYQSVFTAAAHFHSSAGASEADRQRAMQLVDRHLNDAKSLNLTQALDPKAFSPKFLEQANALLN